MKKKIIQDAKKLGLVAEVKYSRPEMHAVVYEVVMYRNDEIVSRWDGGYFVYEEGTTNSKESMIENWNKFIKTHQQ
jgi:hypothetical protein